METYRDLSRGVARRRPEMLEMMAELVGVESPTEDRTAVNRCVTLLEKWIRTSGGKSRRNRQRTAGDLLIGRFGPSRGTP